MDERTPVKMSVDECWQALRGHEFGRLAFHLLGDVHLTPINYAVDGETPATRATSAIVARRFVMTRW